MPDARYYNGPPDERDDAYEHDGHCRPSAAQRFHDACEGMLAAIETAADPRLHGARVGVAVWWSRHVMREARKHGYPTTYQLETEHLRKLLRDEEPDPESDPDGPRGGEGRAHERDQQYDLQRTLK